MTIRLECAKCSTSFMFDTETYRSLKLHHVPRQCPSCADRSQRRPETARVLARECLAEFGPCQNLLPVSWFHPYQADGQDRGILRATVKGCPDGHGVSWSGRLDIFVLAQIVPQVVRVRVMTVTHADAHRTYDPSYRYLVLEPTDGEAHLDLIYVSIDYKTTLKGFGQQYHAELDASQALWACHFSNSARSGRFGTQGAVVVVDGAHPVVTRQWGDTSATRYYPTDAEAVIVAGLISPEPEDCP